jgi:hypothetical protein
MVGIAAPPFLEASIFLVGYNIECILLKEAVVFLLVGGQPDVLVNKIGSESLSGSGRTGWVTVGGGDVEHLTEEGLIGLPTGDQPS